MEEQEANFDQTQRNEAGEQIVYPDPVEAHSNALNRIITSYKQEIETSEGAKPFSRSSINVAAVPKESAPVKLPRYGHVYGVPSDQVRPFAFGHADSRLLDQFANTVQALKEKSPGVFDVTTELGVNVILSVTELLFDGAILISNDLLNKIPGQSGLDLAGAGVDQSKQAFEVRWVWEVFKNGQLTDVFNSLADDSTFRERYYFIDASIQSADNCFRAAELAEQIQLLQLKGDLASAPSIPKVLPENDRFLFRVKGTVFQFLRKAQGNLLTSGKPVDLTDDAFGIGRLFVLVLLQLSNGSEAPLSTLSQVLKKVEGTVGKDLSDVLATAGNVGPKLVAGIVASGLIADVIAALKTIVADGQDRAYWNEADSIAEAFRSLEKAASKINQGEFEKKFASLA